LFAAWGYVSAGSGQLAADSKNFYRQSKVAACCQLLAASFIYPMLHAIYTTDHGQ